MTDQGRRANESTATADRASLLLRSAALIVLAVVLVFWPVVSFQFVRYDDQDNIYNNPAYNPPTWTSIADGWTEPKMWMYIPVTTTAWGAIAWLARGSNGHLNPAYFHWANLFIHVVAALLVFGILRRLRFSLLAALLGALIFALNPVQVEAVAWATGLKDLLAGALALGALWAYLGRVEDQPEIRNPKSEIRNGRHPIPPQFDYARHAPEYQGRELIPGRDKAVSSMSSASAPARRNRSGYAAATLLFVLAMLAKPTAAVLPVLALVIDRWMRHKSWRHICVRLVPWFVLSAIALLVARMVQPVSSAAHVSAGARLLIAGDSVAFYIVHALVPLRLSIDYGRSPRWLMQQAIVWINWLFPAVLCLLAWVKWRRFWPAPAVFIAALLPVIGLASFDFQQHSTVADRYLYLAMLGMALLAALLAQRFPRWAIPLLLLALIFYGGKSFEHEWAWTNSQSLFAQTLAVNPSSDIANNGMGIILADQAIARHDPQLRDQAMAHFEQAIATNPRSVMAHYNLGVILALSHDSRAAAEFRIALQLDPSLTAARRQLEHFQSLKGQ